MDIAGLMIASPWSDPSRQYLSQVQFAQEPDVNLLQGNQTAIDTLNTIGSACQAAIQANMANGEEFTFVPACSAIIDGISQYYQQTQGSNACFNCETFAGTIQPYNRVLTHFSMKNVDYDYKLATCVTSFTQGDLAVLGVANVS